MTPDPNNTPLDNVLSDIDSYSSWARWSHLELWPADFGAPRPRLHPGKDAGCRAFLPSQGLVFEVDAMARKKRDTMNEMKSRTDKQSNRRSVRTKGERFEFRLDGEDLDRIETAAILERVDTSKFVRAAAVDRASLVIREAVAGKSP